MGFDIHGMNPIVRKGKKPEKPKGLYEGKKIDEDIEKLKDANREIGYKNGSYSQ